MDIGPRRTQTGGMLFDPSLVGYKCTVCGFRGLAAPPYRDGQASGETCRCCGTEIGVDDKAMFPQVLRRRWMREGMPWWDIVGGPPPGWDPQLQVEALAQPDWRPALETAAAFLEGRAGAIATARALADHYDPEAAFDPRVMDALQAIFTVDDMTDDVLLDPSEPPSPGVRTGAGAREAEEHARPLVEGACETLLAVLPSVGRRY